MGGSLSRLISKVVATCRQSAEERGQTTCASHRHGFTVLQSRSVLVPRSRHRLGRMPSCPGPYAARVNVLEGPTVNRSNGLQVWFWVQREPRGSREIPWHISREKRAGGVNHSPPFVCPIPGCPYSSTAKTRAALEKGSGDMGKFRVARVLVAIRTRWASLDIMPRDGC